jgi:spore maturation protein A
MNVIWMALVWYECLVCCLEWQDRLFTKGIFEAGKVCGSLSTWWALSPLAGSDQDPEDCGIIYKCLSLPPGNFLFRKIPAGHPAITNITLNLLANMLGIGNAATPLGIRAMEDLQTLNPEPDTVSFEMMLFIVINTASVQIIPFTVIGLLASFGPSQPHTADLGRDHDLGNNGGVYSLLYSKNLWQEATTWKS